ncbi:hypothetical protein COLO4_04786 [Corchorus olitorius]|uniref:Uncharacterized protein n=1 Tax=Corchorus olitorius TaxID=93759 RepID=A0A1R3KSS2_9ROSI|nr:hypothetical protein COLO4_04786 [Corchorus olitorius]
MSEWNARTVENDNRANGECYSTRVQRAITINSCSLQKGVSKFKSREERSPTLNAETLVKVSFSPKVSR